MRIDRTLRPLWSVLAAVLMSLVAAAAAAQTSAPARPTEPTSRAEATRILAEMRRIVTPEGIEKLQKVRIGGIDQWISIRGFDRRNPVLLFIHGGPGFPAMPTSWYYQRGWEEYFTVVQWDQRGAGKTYAANDPARIAPTLTVERMIADTEELIAFLRKELAKDRIFVLGHSWGSYLGLEIARRHPDWLHAYIGMGQVTDSRRSELLGWRFAMERARQANNAEAVRELQSIAGYEQADSPSFEAIHVQRKWLNFYGGAVRGRKGFDHENLGMKLAPEYTDEDVRLVWAANELSESHLLPEVLTVDFSALTRLQCPVILFNGRDDYNVSAALAAQWLERLTAPSKQLVWFERSAHDIMNEETGKLLLSLVHYARPIAERAGDVPAP